MPNESRCIWKEVSDRGVRDDNQDRAISISPDETELIKKKGVLSVVCDGVGNEMAGKRAAELAADVCLDGYYTDDSIDPTRALQAAIARAQQNILDEAQAKRLDGMSTTIVAAVVLKNKLTVAHVGDSRAYLLRDGRLIRVTQDHTSLANTINEGSLTREETRKISKRRAITRLLGTAKATPDIATRELRWGDRVLLCTDGLYDALDDARMEEILAKNGNPERACNALVRAAMANNSNDNITASVLNYGEVKAAVPIGPIALGVGGLALIAALVFLAYTLLTRPSTPASDAMPTSEPVPTAANVAPTKAAPAVGAGATASVATVDAGVKPVEPTATPSPAETAAPPTDTPAPEATPTLAPTSTQPPPATARPRVAATSSGNTGAPAPAQNVNDPPPSFEIVVPQAGVSLFTNPRYDWRIISTGFERWGKPTAGGGCEQYYDVTPVYQLKLTMELKNNTNAPLRGWSAQYFAGGAAVTTCHDGGGVMPTIPPGESRVVRLLAYVNNDQSVSSLVINNSGTTERTCFAANKVVRCG